ncbi:hypothetical protein PG999_011776 [Apiospora kogelbergensis]|uniref:Topoisomerase 6 subunit A/Spo11 TOPRIM domain-containing protein n=1 Tax=Apiospora kogelbergensis TaxID=1337665 RepID=A0AAW0QF91_9PEZI
MGNGSVIERIEDIVESVVDAMSENRPLTIPLRSRSSGNELVVSFPSNNAAGIKKFGGQSYVDRLVDDLAFTLGVGRNGLNVVAASKGLVAGQPFTVEKGDQAVAVPPAETVVNLDLRSVGWVLIIEKEATFRSLVHRRYHENSDAGPGILMTAKGYPDLASRQFIHRISSSWTQIPIYALMDFDPDGVSIMRTYKHGSIGMRHEESITVPGLTWLGVKHGDLLDLQMRLLPLEPSGSQESQSTLSSSQCSNNTSSRTISRSMSGSSGLGEAGWKLLSMSCRDRAKAVRLLGTLEEQHHQNAEEMEQASELRLMLMLNMKFEIQAVHEAEDLAHWLDARLSSIRG